jgi:hypothetical protein
MVVQFIVLAVVVLLLLWVLQQFPTLDPFVIKLIRILLVIVLVIAFLNVILAIFFSTSLGHYMRLP